jgi:hypothetical protein
MEGTGLLPHLDETRHLRREPIPGAFVDLVTVGSGEELGIPGDQPGGEGGDTGQTAQDSVLGMDRVDDSTGLLCGKMAVRDGDYHLQHRMERKAEWHSLGGDESEAPVDCGRDIVGVPFQLHRDPVDMIGTGLLPRSA